MAFSLKEFIIGGKTFCCFLPVRFGVLVMSFLSIVLSGTLSVIIWFELASSHSMSSGLRAAFVIAGLVETFLFLVSILGFTGAIVRKQLFIMIYAYFLHFHFLLNVAIASYFLWMVTHAANTDIQAACEEGLQNMGTKDQCKGLLNIAKGVYFAVASFVLLTEMYGMIIVTRYFRQLRGEKRNARASQIVTDGAFRLRQKHARYRSDLSQNIGLLDQDFDPYAEFVAHGSSAATPDVPVVEEGYGGGRWTHDEIIANEKERLRQLGEGLTEEGSTESEAMVDGQLLSTLPIVGHRASNAFTDIPPAYQPGDRSYADSDTKVPSQV